VAKLKAVAGAKVRLLKDIVTRGGTRFRAGVVMRLFDTDFKFSLKVSVRGRRHSLTLDKKDGYSGRYFEVIWVPDKHKESE
jgi:hypothetical protein